MFGADLLHRRARELLACVLAFALCSGAGAQDGSGRRVLPGPPESAGAAEISAMPPPPLASSVERLLEGGLLGEAEKREARLRHGVWTDGDLDSPAARARAALVTGALTDPSLADPRADVLDRAEAAAARGELAASVAMLAGEGSVRAMRIRAEALERLGRFAEADAALDPLVLRLSRREVASGDEMAEAVLALLVRNRLRGPGRAGEAGADFRALAELLARARDELDRLSWRVRLAEAELLWDKDNPEEAQAAATEALRLNPRCAGAWRLLGEMAVSAFDLDRAEAVALRLEALAPGSADGAMVRASAALRRRDAAMASEVLDAALERTPDHRGLLALRAAAAAVAFDEGATRGRLSAFDGLNGTEGSPEALLAVGAALAEARQYAEAAGMLRRAAERQPNLARPWIELGLLEIQAGRDVRARDALERATALDPFNVRARNSLALVEMIGSFEEIETEHFVVRFASGVDGILAAEMAPVLERIHREVCGPGMFDHEPAERTVIELMPDHASFSVRITGMPALHTMAAATGPVIALEAPRSGPGMRAGPYDWARTVRHEYIHTVTLSRTRNRIPHWFTEAAAVWGEGSPRRPEWWALLASAYQEGTLFDLETISLRFVRPVRPQDRSQAYAQGDWMYEYIVEDFGVEAPLRMMDLYAEGAREAEAMERVLGLTPEAFFEGFLAWAGGELERIGMRETPGVEALVGDPSRATAERIAEALEEHPGHAGLLRLELERALREGGGKPTPEMIPLLERYAAARPVDPMPRRHLARLALDGEMADAPERAIEHLAFLDAHEVRSPAYALALSTRLAEAGRLDEAWASALRARMIAPFDPRTREQAARIALVRGDLDAAEHELEALARLEPDRDLHQRRLEALRARRGE